MRQLKINYRSLALKDVDQCVDIANLTLGVGYFLRTELEKVFLDDKKYASIVACVDDVVVGFCFFYLLNVEDVYKELKIINICEKLKIFDVENLEVLKTVAVLPDYQKQGIATSLIKEAVNFFDNYKVISVAWKNGEVVNVRKSLEKNNFFEVEELMNYWMEDSKLKNENNYCPRCGKVCSCSAVLFAF